MLASIFATQQPSFRATPVFPYQSLYISMGDSQCLGTLEAGGQAAAKTASRFMVNTDDLTRWDSTHWNSAGQILIGQRLYNVIMQGGSGV